MTSTKRSLNILKYSSIGLTLILFGIIFYLLIPALIESVVKKQLVLSKSAYTYDSWKEVPIPIYMSFYLFNVTNHAEFYSDKSNMSKLSLQEVGPYVFEIKMIKENITFNNNGTVSYIQKKVYYFVENKSKGSLSDLVWHWNIALLSAGYSIKSAYNSEPFLYYSIETACNGSKVDCSLFLRHSVGELLFDGYDDVLLNDSSKFFHLPFTKFGYFYDRNDTSTDGIYTVFTGEKDINKLGLIDNWKGENDLSNYWSGNCRKSLGKSSTGDFRPPYSLINSNEPIYLFNGEVCRSLKLNFQKDVEVNGIKCKRYVADQTLFDYSIDDNKCYCVGDNTCPRRGVANISACAYGAPFFISYPHFLSADQSYRSFISGLEPNPDKHLFYMDIEPTFGIPLSANAKIQINVLIEKDPKFIFTQNFTHNELFVPQLWTAIRGDISEEFTDKLKIIINIIPLVHLIISAVSVCVGAIILIIVSYYNYCKNSNNQKTK